MRLTVEQQEWIQLALVATGVAGWVLLAAVARRRRGAAWLADPLADTPIRAGRVDLLTVLLSIGAYVLASSAMLAVVGAVAREDPHAFAASTTSLPATVPAAAGISPVALNLADSVAKLLACVPMVLLLAGQAEGGLRGAGLAGGRLGQIVLWAVGGYLLVVPLCQYSADWALFLVRLHPAWQEPTHPVVDMLSDPSVTATALAVSLLSALVAAPLAEELFFRGIVQNALVGALRHRWAGIVLSGLAFGVVHMGVPQNVLPLTVLGIALGFIYQATGSLWACILLHVLFNGVTVTFSLLGAGAS